MSGLVRLVIPARSGPLTIRTTSGLDCANCPEPATLAIEPHRLPAVPICGNCLVTGMALYLGRTHLEAGGDIADLAIPPREDTDGPAHQ